MKRPQTSPQASSSAVACDVLGCDFSSSPSARKQIVVASGRLSSGVLKLHAVERFRTLDDWQSRLASGPWVGAFDLPFGLPRELVQAQGWPLDWETSVRCFASQSRADLRIRLKAFCDARPVGAKFAHRQTDGPAGSSPSMKWVNPPVAWMLHAGVPRLLEVGAVFPAHQQEPPRQSLPCGTGIKGEATQGHHGQPDRVTLEGYPALLARELLGGRVSYKSDDPVRQTPSHLLLRKDMLTALELGKTRLGSRLKLSPAQAEAIAADGTGDSLDAVLCMVQAAWAMQQQQAGHPNWGLPDGIDPLEGWILSA